MVSGITGAALAGGAASRWSAFGGGSWSFSQGVNPVAPVPGFGSTNGSSYQAYAVNVAGYLKNLSMRIPRDRDHPFCLIVTTHSG